jgi:hypothetical protein
VSIPDFSLITPEAHFRFRRHGLAEIRLWFYFMRYQSKVSRWKNCPSKIFDTERIFEKFCDMPYRLNPPEM